MKINITYKYSPHNKIYSAQCQMGEQFIIGISKKSFEDAKKDLLKDVGLVLSAPAEETVEI